MALGGLTEHLHQHGQFLILLHVIELVDVLMNDKIIPGLQNLYQGGGFVQ